MLPRMAEAKKLQHSNKYMYVRVFVPRCKSFQRKENVFIRLAKEENEKWHTPQKLLMGKLVSSFSADIYSKDISLFAFFFKFMSSNLHRSDIFYRAIAFSWASGGSGEPWQWLMEKKVHNLSDGARAHMNSIIFTANNDLSSVDEVKHARKSGLYDIDHIGIWACDT